jgi:hypothetical protein
VSTVSEEPSPVAGIELAPSVGSLVAAVVGVAVLLPSPSSETGPGPPQAAARTSTASERRAERRGKEGDRAGIARSIGSHHRPREAAASRSLTASRAAGEGPAWGRPARGRGRPRVAYQR